MYLIFFLASLTGSTISYSGYDSGGGSQNSCGRPYRTGRMHVPPCNLAHEGGYCMNAGEHYPWHAVRRFVRENQGLMKRMYGDQPEGVVLRRELGKNLDHTRYAREKHPDSDNELYRDDEDEFESLFDERPYYKESQFEGRYLKDPDILNTKFIYSEEPTLSIKLAGLKTAPHFRSTTSTSSPSTSTQSTIPTTTASTIDATSTTISSLVSEDFENSTAALVRDLDDAEENTTVEIDVLEQSIEIISEEEVLTKTTAGDASTSTTTPGPTKHMTTVTRDQSTTDEDKPGNVLFQDMEDDKNQDKVKVNYKLAGVNACPVKEEVVAPFWANNTRGEVLALLNMYPFEQYVHWEKCTFENRQMYCRDGCRCEQQYRLHRLLAYDPNNECRGIFSDWFRFPSCCICKCYGLPPEFRMTSRSPRQKDGKWYKSQRKGEF